MENIAIIMGLTQAYGETFIPTTSMYSKLRNVSVGQNCLRYHVLYTSYSYCRP